MAVTVNQAILEAEIGHQVDLSHYSNGVVNRLIGLLNRVDRDLFMQLMQVLDSMPAESFTVERLDSLLLSVRMLNAQAYREFGTALTGDLQDLTQVEATYQNELFTNLLPTQLRVATVDAGQVYAAAMARPMQGRLLNEWASSIEADRMTRIRDAVRMGYVESEPINKIVQRIKGTQARGYADGIIEIDRRNAESVVRTAVSHTAGFTRDKFYQANDDLVKGLLWCSTLDTRTSNICRERDKKEYDLEHKPVGHKLPWLGGPGAAHWCCRSSSTAILKSWDELGIPGVPEFKNDTRASMDGEVPAETTYADWLGKQSAKRQDQVLGPTRGAMLRKGVIAIDKFTNDKGRWLSLEELAARK